MRSNSKCFLCGNLTSNLRLRTQSINDAQLLQDWKRKLATSLCDILGLEQEIYESIFQSASYCACCQESICTVDFTFRTIEKFQSNLTSLRSDIVERLDHHYEEIKPEVHDPVVLDIEGNISLENIIKTIQNVKQESDASDAEGRHPHDVEHEYILPTSIPSSPCDDRRERLLKLKRRIPLTHVQVSSLPVRRVSSEKKKTEKETGTPFIYCTDLVETVITDSNDGEEKTSFSTSRTSRSGRVIRPVQRLAEISVEDVAVEDDSEFMELDDGPDEQDTEFVEGDGSHVTDEVTEPTSTDYPGGDEESKIMKRKVSLKDGERQKKLKSCSNGNKTDDGTLTKFRCRFCTRKFLSESNMEAHVKRDHRLKEPKSFPCRICYKLNRSVYMCKTHESLHQENAPLTCVCCQKTLTDQAELIHHVQKEHDSRTVWCNFAGCQEKHVAYESQKDMKIHLATKHKLEGRQLELLHHCSRCELRFRTKTFLESHLIKAHQILEGDALTCQFCSRAFVGAWRLKRHQDNIHTALERNPKCSVCNKSFPTPEATAEHELLHISSVRNLFDCVLCDEKPNNSRELRSHVLKAHEILPFKCVELGCDSIGFETEWKLKRHQDANHYPIEKAKCCNQCSFRTNKLSKLKIHMARHEGKKEFPCTVENCTKRFFSAGSRRTHFRIKHGGEIFNFPCKVCSKTFKSISALADHETYHSDRRPYLCEICSATFKTTNTLVHHMRVHDPNKKTKNNWKLQRPRKPRLSKTGDVVKEKTTGTRNKDRRETIDEAEQIMETEVQGYSDSSIGEIESVRDIPQNEQNGGKVIALATFPGLSASLPDNWF